MKIATKLLLLPILWSCQDTPTQVVVKFHAHPDLDTTGTRIQLWLWPDGTSQNQPAIDVGEFPFRPGIPVPVEPMGGDPSRRFTLFAELLAEDERLAWARVRTGFERDELREIRIELSPGCPEPADRPSPDTPLDDSTCGPHETCRDRGCARACYNPERFQNEFRAEPSESVPCPRSDCLPVDRVETGWEGTCALAAGDAYCWGRIHSALLPALQPRRVVSPRGTVFDDGMVTDIAFGSGHVCLVREGRVQCGGVNSDGQLGHAGSTVLRCCTSEADAPSLRGLDAESDYTCALDESGAIWCTGDSRFGPATDRFERVTGGEQTRAVLAGRPFVCRRGIDGELTCVGAHPFMSESAPDTSDAEFVIASADTLCVGQTGTVMCWGKGTNDRNDGPYQLQGTGWSAVAIPLFPFGELSRQCGIREGELFCWGTNDSRGRLGTTLPEAGVDTPARIGSRSDWISLSLGTAHGCAINTASELYCWGSNQFGQLGHEGEGPQPERVCVPSW